MAIEIQLPCDGDDVCMRCKTKPPTEECLTCVTCVTPWHAHCLASPPQSLASTAEWKCPDCSGDVDHAPVTGIGSSDGIVAAIRAIEADATLTEAQKARKRQRLMSGEAGDDDEVDEKKSGDDVDQSFMCCMCMNKLKKPVSTPCGHNFCLVCFKRWVDLGNYNCAKCRREFSKKLAKNIKINLTIVAAIRLSNAPAERASVAPPKIYHHINNEDRPEQAFRTDRAKKPGNANAAGGRIQVTIPPDHFGPITAEYDPKRNRGVLVGDSWKDRQECRQWGVHFPHVSGIAGQSKYGAQSVVLSGGYVDDQDHGEYILYTGCGGRDLSGNKRTNKKQAWDQTFESFNAALKLSCQMGYPVRVIRSDKKRNAYAPAEGVRYDGVYRVEKCWRNVGKQGTFKMCRYLFVRCDNEPAPWTSDEHGDRPRALPEIEELANATDLFERNESPSWDFDEAEGCWKWVKPPPPSRLAVHAMNPEERKKRTRTVKAGKNNTMRNKLLKEFGCLICKKVMSLPVTTPCGHNFCKECLEAKFAGISQMKERSRGGRTLRAQKNVMSCPSSSCLTDISDFLQNPQVNRELMELIEKLKKQDEEPIEENEEEGAPCKKMKLDA